MASWIWIAPSVVLAIHDEQLAEHGGAMGIRDAGLLESALGRPQNPAAYGDPDHADLAAAYAYGIARNPPLSTATSAPPSSPPSCSWPSTASN